MRCISADIPLGNGGNLHVCCGQSVLFGNCEINDGLPNLVMSAKVKQCY